MSQVAKTVHICGVRAALDIEALWVVPMLQDSVPSFYDTTSCS